MDKKYIIAIVAVVAVVAIIGGYFLFNNNSIETSEHTTLELSESAYMNVPNNPEAANKSKADKNGIYYYVDDKDDINITSLSNVSTSSGVSKMNELKNSIEKGSKKIMGDDVVVYLKDGIYSIFMEDTEYKDIILIQSKNKNLLLQCWDTIKFHSPTDKLKLGNKPKEDSTSTDSTSVVSAVEKTQNAVESSSSSSFSSSSSSSSESYSSYSDSFGYSSGSSSGGSSGGGSSGGGSSYTDSFG